MKCTRRRQVYRRIEYLIESGRADDAIAEAAAADVGRDWLRWKLLTAWQNDGGQFAPGRGLAKWSRAGQLALVVIEGGCMSLLQELAKTAGAETDPQSKADRMILLIRQLPIPAPNKRYLYACWANTSGVPVKLEDLDQVATLE